MVKEKYSSSSEPITAKAEQKAKKTGKLDPLVDPAGYGAIRRSLPRFENYKGFYKLSVGTPIPVETRLDTTGSMGGNVDIAFKVLPDTHELISKAIPGCDIQLAIGIFGDVSDKFVLCRPQFEMTAEKIVHQLSLMVPERDGGDEDEDPHYGLFGGAYLTSTYLNKIGLKGYDFTVSDARARDWLDVRQLKRVFGDDVFERTADNGNKLDEVRLTTANVVSDLLKISHAFFIQVGNNSSTTNFWEHSFGRERVIVLPNMKFLPHTQAAIIGLTEGTFSLSEVGDFLMENNLSKEYATQIARAVSDIPIGAQAKLPNFKKRPKIGDLFKEKTDLWPIDPKDIAIIKETNDKKEESGTTWL